MEHHLMIRGVELRAAVRAGGISAAPSAAL